MSQRQCPTGTAPYIIRAGDTYFSLAIRFNTTVPAIIAANPGVDPNLLMIGQVICIPTRPQIPPCPGGNLYVIRPGDTLFAISRFFNVSLNALIAANPGIDPNRLFVGQIICIPVTPPVTCPTGTTPYTIQAGDTFFAIAARFNTTVAALIAANPGVNPDALLIGQIICVPVVTPPPAVCPTGFTTYVIQPGDTFFALAARFNTTVAILIQANPGVNPNALMIGQRICVPVVSM